MSELARASRTDRPRVALVTCDDHPELYADDRPLVAALAALGVAPVPVVWSRADVDWRSFAAIVIRSPWDYFKRIDEFRGWLTARIASGVRLINPPAVLEWNFDKRYLQDLARDGVSLVPTICVARRDRVDIAALARARGWHDIVVKPTISGGAYRTIRFDVDDYPRHAGDIALALEDCGVLVQPFLPEIVSAGELSLLFFDGEFSHAVCKRPRTGDYRVQFQYGGTWSEVDVDAALIAQARACIGHAPGSLAYARVDGVVKDGAFLVMELEVFEPVMFLGCRPEAAARFARAIVGRLGPSYSAAGAGAAGAAIS